MVAPPKPVYLVLIVVILSLTDVLIAVGFGS